MILRVISFALSASIFVLTALIWWQRCQMPYNEQGRYFDGLIVYEAHSVGIYAALTLFSLIVTITTAFWLWRVRRTKWDTKTDD